MAERPKLSGRQIKELFYTEVEDDKRQSIDSTDGSKMTYRCRCGKVRTQSLKHGYTNLAQHVHVKHPEWVAAVMEDASIAPKLASALQASPVASEPAQKRAKRAPRAANKTSSRNGRASIGNDDSASADAGAGSSPQSPARDVSPKQVKEAQDASPKRVKRPLSSSTESESEMTPAKPSPPPSSAKSTPVQQQSLKAATVSPLAATAAAAKPTGVQKRDDYLSWDDYFMSVAFLSAMRSKGTRWDLSVKHTSVSLANGCVVCSFCYCVFELQTRRRKLAHGTLSSTALDQCHLRPSNEDSIAHETDSRRSRFCR